MKTHPIDLKALSETVDSGLVYMVPKLSKSGEQYLRVSCNRKGYSVTRTLSGYQVSNFKFTNKSRLINQLKTLTGPFMVYGGKEKTVRQTVSDYNKEAVIKWSVKKKDEDYIIYPTITTA